MKPFFYHGRISSQLLHHVIENSENFELTMRRSVEAFGGSLVNCFFKASSGGEPAGFLLFPNDLSARAWNIFYGSQNGVLESHIERLLDSDDLKALGSQISASKDESTGHRDPGK
ncbi:hypothetical protein GOD01_30245 [Sinorhizobium medicae]|nr:hypothetical protein [Sinorhizobium medicae]